MSRDSSRPQNSDAPHNRFERFGVIIKIFLVLFVTIGVDALAGTLLSAVGLYTPAGEVERAYRTRHAIHHHALLANVDDAAAQWGPAAHRISTNSLAFKDHAPREIPLTSDKPRLLLIGDSFTEGVGIPFKDTFAGILTDTLAPRGIEVLNAGVSSYSPVIYRRKIRYLFDEVGLKVDRVIVFLDLSDLNDEFFQYEMDKDGNVVSRSTNNANGLDERIKHFIATRTIVLANLRILTRKIRHAIKSPGTVEEAVEEDRSIWTLDDREYEAWGKRGLEIAREHMDALRVYLSDKGIPLTLVVYPWPAQIKHQDLDSRHVRYWRDWSEEHEVEFVNLFPKFIGVGEADQVIEDLFIPGDVHWNERGHKVIADSLLERLKF